MDVKNRKKEVSIKPSTSPTYITHEVESFPLDQESFGHKQADSGQTTADHKRQLFRRKSSTSAWYGTSVPGLLENQIQEDWVCSG